MTVPHAPRVRRRPARRTLLLSCLLVLTVAIGVAVIVPPARRGVVAVTSDAALTDFSELGIEGGGARLEVEEAASPRGGPVIGGIALSEQMPLSGAPGVPVEVAASGGQDEAIDLSQAPEPPSVLPPVPDPAADALDVYLVAGLGGTGGLDAGERAEVATLGVRDARGSDLLTDALLVVVIDPVTQRAAAVSVPRDTWLAHRRSRINAVYASAGVQALRDEVGRALGVGVDHVLRVDFLGFARLVDALGGVDVTFPAAVRDADAHLDIGAGGCRRLDGREALAYARARHLEVRDGPGGTWRPRGQADLGRVQRQRDLLGALWDQHRGPGLVLRLPQIMGVLRRHVVVDAEFDLTHLADLARVLARVGSATVEEHTLPVRVGRIGRASVVFVEEVQAEALRARLRAWPATNAPAPRSEPPPPPPAAPAAALPSEAPPPTCG